jgi:hypothetical protein
MLSIFETNNIPIAHGKTQGASQVIEFMGISLDTIKKQALLPADKIERLHAIFGQF